MLVFVIGVARRATRLFYRVTDHRNHDVIGQSALAWTVIVQNVTEPRLALLHQRKLPTDVSFRRGRCERLANINRA